LSRRVLFGDLVDGGRVTVTIDNDDLAFEVTELPKPLSKAERKAIKAAKTAELVQVVETSDENTEN
jgi:hypothetical protein